jgi:predicted GNAT family N-acyltransferase
MTGKQITELAKHLAAMVTPKDSTRYTVILKDNEEYLEHEIGNVITQSRLEGAKAMQEMAGHVAAMYAYTPKSQKGVAAIRAIDPQQVINESMGK